MYLSKNRKEGVTENDSFIKSLDYFYQNINSFDELLSTKKFVFDVLHESKNRIEAVLAILRLEKENMNNDLHAVIVFDNASSPHLTLLIEKICNDRQLADLDAVLLLQDVIIADKDITAFVEMEALKWSKKLRLDFKLKDKKMQNGLCLIEGSGSDWKTGIFTLFFTEMFEKSLIRCLIGPRSILGEGWDSVKLNTLVDLTSVSAYQTVIQTKGRAYRIDEKNLSKLSNIWDVAVVDPEIPCGLSDFFNIVRKHKHFYALSEDGIIEKGIGHTYPSMQEDIIELCYRIKSFNEEMKKKAHERHRYLELWKIGQKYENIEALSFDVAFDRRMLKLARIKDRYYQLFDREIIEETSYQYKRKENIVYRNEKIEDIVKHIFEMYAILDDYLKKTGKLDVNISFIAKEFQNLSIKKRSGPYFRISTHSTDKTLEEAIQNLFHLNKSGYALPLSPTKQLKNNENPHNFYWIGLYGLKADEAKIAQIIWSRLVSVGKLLEREYIEPVHREQKKKIKVNKKIIWM